MRWASLRFHRALVFCSIMVALVKNLKLESLQARAVLRVRYDLQGRIAISGSERNTTQKRHKSAH